MRLYSVVVTLIGVTGLCCLNGATVAHMGIDTPADQTTPRESTAAEPLASPSDSKPRPKPSELVRIYFPQPNLRHATDRYEIRFCMPPGDVALLNKIIALRDEDAPTDELVLDEEPLQLLADRVAEMYRIPVQIDIRALEDLGLDEDIPVTCCSQNGSLASVLWATLDPLDLGFTIRNQTLFLTTKEKQREEMVVACYPFPTSVNDGNTISQIVDMMMATVAADSWDVVGGQGAIRFIPASNEFIVRQTLEVHFELRDLLRDGFDSDLEPANPLRSDAPIEVPIRSYAAPASSSESLPEWIVAKANQSLGAAGDPRASAELQGERILVSSTSRPFHVFVAELIRSMNGFTVVEPASTENPNEFPRSMHAWGMGICWVAREVYGATSPRWRLFRSWLLDDGPQWLRDGYAAHGEAFALWIRDRPCIKPAIRLLMDAAIASHSTAGRQ